MPTFAYHPVKSNDDITNPGSSISANKINQRPRTFASRHWPWLLHGGFALLWVLLLFNTYAYELHHQDVAAEFYSPAHEAVEYEDRVFTSNIFTHGRATPRTKYSGPLDDENDKAWHYLTRGGMVMFPASEEAKLPNRTTAYLKKPGMHFGNMEMFHSLHCLDMLRRSAYNKTLVEKFYHLDHCTEYLRQTIQCRGDTNIMPFKLNETTGEYHPIFDNVHRCRKFEPLYEWSMEHQAGEMITA